MESVSVTGVSVSVALIIEGFAEASRQFKNWRKQRGKKKAVGQEELEASLYEGEKSVERKLKALIAEHGNKFETGDAQSRANFFKIRTDFRNALIDVLISALAREEGKKVVVDPIALRLVSETAQKDTLHAMDNLAQRIQTPQSPGNGRPDPDDMLPVFPPPPRRSPNASNTSLPNKLRKSPPSNESKASLSPEPTPMSSQASLSGSDKPVSASSSQASLEKPQSVGGQEEIYTPRPIPNLLYPYASNGGSASSSLSLVSRASSSRSIISRMFSSANLAPRPYSNIPPLPPIPTIVPSYKCTGDSEDVLEEGREEVDRLWALADDAWETPQDRRPHSAPLVQEEWSMFPKDEFDEIPPPSASAIMPPPKEYLTPAPLPAPVSHQLRPPLEGGKRVRSEPTMTFSKPAPRFGRHVSGPLGSY